MSSVGNTTASITAAVKRFSVRSEKQRRTPSIGTTGKAGTRLLSTTLPTSTRRLGPRSKVPFPLQFFRMENGALPHSNNLTPAKTRSEMTGLFFCLAPAEGAWLLFCPAAIQPHTIVYSAFFAVHASYIANAAKQRTGLYSVISGNLPCFTAIIYVHPAILHHLRHAGRLYRSAQPPYYNKVYKGAAVRPCYRSMPDCAAHRRPCQRKRVSASGLHPVQRSARRLAI